MPNLGYYLELCIALVLFAQGVYALWPNYDLPNTSFWKLAEQASAQDVVGSLLIISSLLLFWGLSQNHFPTRRAFRRVGSFMAFVTMAFLSWIGILSEEVNDVYWLATGGLAVMAAVMYVKVGRQTE